ncbi:MAG TPA: stage II sporulation protein M [Candidatus Dormibacteraeota bacterium]|jgi:uncharacterized membrane protein SpoIIM required for sporulation
MAGWPAWLGAALGLYLLGGWMGAFAAALTPGLPITQTNSIGSVLTVFQHNLQVLALISGGVLTLGLSTAAELFLNGTLLGFVGLELIQRHQVAPLVTGVVPQLPLELGAYVLAGGATLRVGWSLWWPFLSRRAGGRVPWKGWLVAEAAAVCMLFGGAVVEVLFSHV